MHCGHFYFWPDDLCLVPIRQSPMIGRWSWISLAIIFDVIMDRDTAIIALVLVNITISVKSLNSVSVDRHRTTKARQVTGSTTAAPGWRSRNRVRPSVFMSLSTVFHSINSSDNSPLSLFFWSYFCLSSIYLFMKVSLSPDITLCGWLGLKHQLTN